MTIGVNTSEIKRNSPRLAAIKRLNMSDVHLPSWVLLAVFYRAQVKRENWSQPTHYLKSHVLLLCFGFETRENIWYPKLSLVRWCVGPTTHSKSFHKVPRVNTRNNTTKNMRYITVLTKNAKIFEMIFGSWSMNSRTEWQRLASTGLLVGRLLHFLLQSLTS